ncbi:uncharacterized protein LOC130628649 [Hydractinia symbiolongicarpus]|uniref:uncharacterized protein LOC130628649 n=1 Tax=Hydractinia symbiolongicarpus TaxID=13093 RepID=UPI00254ABAD3|nr:uncharacterized protein LOC130628649 [Hydractinia symbiolongicarpus]
MRKVNKTFIANRVSEIREVTNHSHWYHIPADENPADAITRGVYNMHELELADCKISWKSGPNSLQGNESLWPSIEILSLDDKEIKRKTVLIIAADRKEMIVSYENYSTFDKLIRILSWIDRFVKSCRGKVKLMMPLLPQEEITNAKRVVFRDAQIPFRQEIQQIRDGSAVSKKSKLAPFKPFLDKSGIIRIGGRLKNAQILFDAKHQIILPNNHVAQLVIRKHHLRCGHAGVNQVLSEVRQTLWILNGRVAVKRVIQKCIDCQKFRSKAQISVMADLPRHRIDLEKPPFTNTGVDFFGPLLIKQGRKRLKQWVSLFTCMTIRCVHLELVESLESDDFLNSLQRFISRRQKPKLIISDCGTDFKGASNKLKQELKKLGHQNFENYCFGLQIEWRFNPPPAPHMGGAWERLVRTVKNTMKFLTKNLVLTDFQLMTLLAETENIVNSRPLTQVSDNPSDFQAVTPNHLLKGFGSPNSSLSLDKNADLPQSFRR